MHITLADLEGMASPGWGGSGFVDLLDEDLDGEVESGGSGSEDDYSEIGLNKAIPEEKPEQEPQGKKRFRYGEDGRREGLPTGEICDRLKNRPLRRDRLEREFLEISKIYPANGADRKILIWLAAGNSYAETAELVGRSLKTVKNAAHRLRQFRDTGKVQLLPPDKVQSGAALLEPFQKSRAGRKPKKTTAEVIHLDLLGDPIQLRARKARRQPTMARKARMRPVCEGQLDLFQEAA